MAKLDDDPADKLDKRIVLRINERELTALTFIAKDMQLSRAEALRSLILTYCLDTPKPKPKLRKGSTLNHG